MIFHYSSVSSIAKWSICRHFTITHFVISTFTNIKIYWSISSSQPVTILITPRILTGNSAWTPPVYFSSFKIHIVREISIINWNRSRSIFSFSIWNSFWDGYSLLFRKIGNIIGISIFFIIILWWLKYSWRNCIRIDFVLLFAPNLKRNSFIVFGFFHYWGHFLILFFV